MIDTKDLMQGNFFEFKGEVQKVHSCEPMVGLIYFNKEGSGKACDPKDANPVLIDTAWLDMVGKRKVLENAKLLIQWQWFPKDCNCIITIYRKKDGYFVTIYSLDENTRYFKAEVLLHCRHELQNFFRVHTGKDLI